MAKRRFEDREDAQQPAEPAGSANPQKPIWLNFDHCWSSCVKNGSDLLKVSAKAHLKSIGMWDDQSKWISGLMHFGIPIEK